MGSNNVPRFFRAQIDSLQKRTGYVFGNPSLLLLAFTQRSSPGAQAASANNERLEFLGDAALNLLVGDALYREYPEADEGFMTIERSKLVCGPNLSAWGYEAGFDRMISAGDGVAVSDAMVEDSVEAVAGAFFLDGGLEAVRCFLQSFRDYPDQGAGFDARRHLERDCAYEKLGALNRVTVPRNQKGRTVYESSVVVDGRTVGTGIGAERDDAERRAAREAMISLNRVSAQERQKREAVSRARFRRVLSRKSRGSVSDAPSMSDAERALASGVVKDGVEYKIASQEGPAHKPVFTAVALRDGVRVAEAKGSSKKAALKALSESVASATESARETAAFRDLNLEALRGTPEVKGCLQTCCERLGIGQPRYVDLPSVGAENHTFFTELKLNGEVIASGSGTSKRAAGQTAAWKVLQVIGAGRAGWTGLLNEGAEPLAAGVETAFCAVMARAGEKDVRVDAGADSENGGLFKARAVAGQKVLAEVSGLSMAQAKTLALMKAVTQSRAWKEMAGELGILGLRGLGDNFRPDLAFESYCRASRLPAPEIVALNTGGGKQPLFRVGLFLDGALCAVSAGSGKKSAVQWLALLLLNRAARGVPLVPDLKKKPEIRPPEKAPAAQPAAVPAPDGKPKEGVLKRLSVWWHRLGELYTRS